jgi:hypothetical protein
VEAHEDGTFELAGITPGEWRIQAECNPVNDPVQRELEPTGGVFIHVTDRDMADLVIRLAEPFVLAIDEDRDATLQDPLVFNPPSVNLLPVQGQAMPEVPYQVRDRVSIVPGRYLVAPPVIGLGVYAASATLGGEEVLGKTIDVTPGMPRLRVVYRKGGSIHGSAAAWAEVILMPTNESSEVLVVRPETADADGAFTFEDVPTGTYSVLALRGVDVMLVEDPSIRDKGMRLGSTVRVDESGIAYLQLTNRDWR